ncbi:MAG: acyl carrier protein [Syntrophobacteraceae bacterium]
MDRAAIQDVVLRTLGQIVPGADIANLNPEKRFRDQFDFDSVDFLNFALKLQDRLRISIPEEDFPSLATLTGCVSYLLSKDARFITPKTQ